MPQLQAEQRRVKLNKGRLLSLASFCTLVITLKYWRSGTLLLHGSRTSAPLARRYNCFNL